MNLLNLKDIMTMITSLAGIVGFGYTIWEKVIKPHRRIRINKVQYLEQVVKAHMTLQKVPFWLSDERGEYIYASPTLCKTMNKSESEILENGWSAWIHPDDIERVFDAWQEAVKHKRDFSEDYRVAVEPGAYVKFRGEAIALKNHKEVIGYLGMLTYVDVI